MGIGFFADSTIVAMCRVSDLYSTFPIDNRSTEWKTAVNQGSVALKSARMCMFPLDPIMIDCQNSLLGRNRESSKENGSNSFDFFTCSSKKKQPPFGQ